MIKKTWLFTFLITSILYSQEVSLLTFLDNTVSESSGITRIDDMLISHNDSGNQAQLYNINHENGEIIRSIQISNATNVDWEDITHDANYIYIGDFGNFDGTRTNLKIYKIDVDEFINAEEAVNAEVISFNYAEQTDYTPSPYTSNFDAESLIVVNDKLYIFTKNWGNFLTDIYELPTIPGDHTAEKVATINALGLISGAEYNPLTQKIALIGYTLSTNFLITLSNIDFEDFSIGNMERNEFETPENISSQIEGITYQDNDTYYLTSESSDEYPAALLELDTATMHVSQVDANEKCSIYPNPASDVVTIDCSGLKYVELYNVQGLLIRKYSGKNLGVKNLPKSAYYLKAYTKDGNFTKKLIKK